MSIYRPATIGGGGGVIGSGITVLSGQYQVSGVYLISGAYQLSGVYPFASGYFQLSGAVGGSVSGSSFVGGIAQFSGNGSGTNFVITHGIGTTPVKFTAIPNSLDAMGDYRVEASGNTLSVIYTTARPSGASNISLGWMADTQIVSGGVLGNNILVGGNAVFSGNTSGTTFLITHNIGVVPSRYGVVPNTVDAVGDYRVEASGNTLSVIYTAARASGASNIGLVWFADTNNVSGGPADPLNVGALNVSGTATFSGIMNAQSGAFTNLTVAGTNILTAYQASGVLPNPLNVTDLNVSGNAVFSGNFVAQSGIFEKLGLQGALVFQSGMSGISFLSMQRLPTMEPNQYIMWVSGTAFQAMNTKNGVIEFSGAECTTVINNIFGSGKNTGMEILLARQNFICSGSIDIPSTNTLRFALKGVYGGRTVGTTLTAASGWPGSGRYLIEHLGAVGSGNFARSYLELEGIFLNNVNNFQGNAGANGAIRYEADASTTPSAQVIMRDMQMQYWFMGIHLIGTMGYGYFEDVEMGDANSLFSGQHDIRMEPGYFGTNPHADRPFINTFVSTRIFHQGQMDSAVRIQAKYNRFYGLDIDGAAYTKGALHFAHSAWSNKIYGLRMQDLNTFVSTAEGAIVFDASGSIADASGGTAITVYENKIYDALVAPYPGALGSGYNVAFVGSGSRNYVELSIFGGTTVKINDSNAGLRNVVRVREGQVIPTSGNDIITSTAGRVTIIDERQGAHGQGIFVGSGDAATAVYTIPHGLFGNPAQSGFVNLVPGSPQARGDFDVSGNASGIIVTYPVAPASGTVRLFWQASLYGY